MALRAKYDYTAMNPDELNLYKVDCRDRAEALEYDPTNANPNKGDKLFGFELMEANMWWYGEMVGKEKRRGMFPVNFVEAVDPKVKKELASLAAPQAAPGTRPAAAPAARGGKKQGCARYISDVFEI